MFQKLLPSCAKFAEASTGNIDVHLFPAEAQAIKKATPKRYVEFSLGRSCAHRALQRLTGHAYAVPTGQDRQPIWPNGVVGSITHCAGLIAAAVARKSDLAGIGIDAEPTIQLPREILHLVCSEREAAWVSGRHIDNFGGKILFCAKEATYKCLFPITGMFLDFQDVELTIPCEGKFLAEIQRGPVRHAAGKWLITESHVCAAIAVYNDCLPSAEYSLCKENVK